jgi:hypothetical protein
MARYKSYNGWPNYSTWNVALWLNNTEWMYRWVQTQIEEIKEKYPDEKFRWKRILASRIRRFVTSGDTFGDIARNKYGAVQWLEIAIAELDP